MAALRGVPAHNRIDLAGRRFGRLLVIEHARTEGKRPYWLCLCDCGNSCTANGGTLKSGSSKSCGCLRAEMTVARNFKHGHSHAKNRWYTIWNSMMGRCYRKRSKDFRLYGARGITVCTEWHSAAVFIAWCEAKEPIERGMSIDRFPDTNGPYAPWNCRFATAKQQSANRRPYSQWEKRA